MSTFTKPRAIDALPFIRNMSLAFNHAKCMARPYLRFVTRVLLVSVFVEDALRTILGYKSHLIFYRRELFIPNFLALFLIAVSTIFTFVASFMVFLKKAEKRGAQILIAVVLYQQVMYGRHSPIASGNFGFLVRNSCLIGTLMLFMTNQRIKDGLPALPGIPHTSSKDSARDTIAFVTRFVLGLLCLEMFDRLGWHWAFIIVPLCLAMLIGYKMDVIGLLLMAFHVVNIVTSKQFWIIDQSHPQAVFERDVVRFEFLQTISIMSGLLMLVMSGPGALSLDEKLKRGKTW